MNTDLALVSCMSLQQQRLLRTLCVDQNIAGAAFVAWNLEADWGGFFDRGSFRLLPAVYKHIESLSIDDPVMGRLRGIYRRSWVRNQRFRSTWSKLHDALTSRGIDALLLGGSGLALGYYRDFGTRHVTGSDLLVRPLQVGDAFTAMCSAGCRFEVHEIDLLGNRHYVPFHDPMGEPGTLRWNLHYGWTEDDLEWFWGSAIPAHSSGLSMSVPGPTAMMIYLLAEMVEQEAWTIVVLLADMNSIIEHRNFDWDQLLREARKYQLVWMLGLTTRCLQTTLGVSIPSHVQYQFSSTSSTVCERLELRLYSEIQSDQQSFLNPVVAVIVRYLHFMRGRRVGEILILSPGFVKQYYGSNNLLQALMQLLRNGVRRAARLLARKFRRASQSTTGLGN